MGNRMKCGTVHPGKVFINGDLKCSLPQLLIKIFVQPMHLCCGTRTTIYQVITEIQNNKFNYYFILPFPTLLGLKQFFSHYKRPPFILSLTRNYFCFIDYLRRSDRLLFQLISTSFSTGVFSSQIFPCPEHVSVRGDTGSTSHNRLDSELALDSVQERELHTQQHTREFRKS